MKSDFRLNCLGLIALIAATAVPAADARSTGAQEDPFVAVTDRPGLPRILLLGDSISIGYTLAVRRLLPEANVHRPPENCRSTRQTLARLETYLGVGKWDVIHFNCGIHDLTFVGPDGKGGGEALEADRPHSVDRHVNTLSADFIDNSGRPVSDCASRRFPS